MKQIILIVVLCAITLISKAQSLDSLPDYGFLTGTVGPSYEPHMLHVGVPCHLEKRVVYTAQQSNTEDHYYKTVFLIKEAEVVFE